MPGMRTAGPACCCCNNIYTALVNSPGDIYRQSVTGTEIKYYDGLKYEYKTHWGFFDLDHVKKKVFASFRVPPADTPQTRVSMLDEDFTNETVLTVVGGSQSPADITSDPDGERVFYLTREAGTPTVATRTLWTVNHDGTGNTSLGNITNDFIQQTSHPLCYCRANQKIYYIAVTPGPKRELFRINADGSGDTLIAARTGLAGVNSVTIDNVNERVLWSEITGQNGASTKIWTADLNGSGATVVYSAAANVTGTPSLQTNIYAAQWSHKHERVYWFERSISFDVMLNPSFVNHWYSCKIDGSDQRIEVDDTPSGWPWSISTGPDEMRLGCGFETLGASSPA